MKIIDPTHLTLVCRLSLRINWRYDKEEESKCVICIDILNEQGTDKNFYFYSGDDESEAGWMPAPGSRNERNVGNEVQLPVSESNIPRYIEWPIH